MSPEVKRAAGRLLVPLLRHHRGKMSARQPFVPSRPASRAVNLSEETRTISNDVFARAVSSNNNAITTEKKNSNHQDFEVQ